MRAPEIMHSTEEERRQYIKDTFKCIADCDMCGLCIVFRGKDPELAYADYISVYGDKSEPVKTDAPVEPAKTDVPVDVELKADTEVDDTPKPRARRRRIEE